MTDPELFEARIRRAIRGTARTNCSSTTDAGNSRYQPPTFRSRRIPFFLLLTSKENRMVPINWNCHLHAAGALLFTGTAWLSGCGGTDEPTSQVPEASDAAVERAAVGTAAFAIVPQICVNAPAITSQPRDAIVHAGRAAMFAVSVTCPNDATFRWLRNGTAMVPPQTSSSVTVPMNMTVNVDMYSVEIRSRFAPVFASPTTSRVALLTVLAANDGRCSAGNRLAGGAGHSLALHANGRVSAWGANGYGQIGNGWGAARPHELTPLLLGSVSNAASVSSWGTSNASFAINQATGRLWAWGYNQFGQLGNGSSGLGIQSNAPVTTSFVLDTVSAATGDRHTLAATGSGVVYSWGDGSMGKLGDGGTASRAQPSALSTITNVTCVAASEGHSLAIKRDGTVWGWGVNGSGHLGAGFTSSFVSTPVQATFPVAGVRALALAVMRDDSFALTDTGEIYMWGKSYGATPRLRVGLPQPAVAIAAGKWHSVALLSDGSVWTWSDATNSGNQFGQLGRGHTLGAGGSTPAPVAVPLPPNVVIVAIGAGGSHTLALASDGSVWAWGNNFSGQLGIGTGGAGANANRSAPARVGTAASWLSLN